MDKVTLLEHPYLFTPKDRRLIQFEWHFGMTVGEITGDTRKRWETEQGFNKFYITVNGFECENLDKFVHPDDFVAISIHHGFQAIMGAVWMALYSAGMYAAINAVAYVITAAIVIGAGLLINSFMSPSVPDTPDSDGGKPSYGWRGMRNETSPGNPVPVIYGRPYSAPQIIGSYRIIDNHDVWLYVLACAGAGKTNNILTDEDVFIGQSPGEQLSTFTNYTFGATDGDIEITSDTRTALANFAKVHHDRPFERRIIHSDRSTVNTCNLLHFNSLSSVSPIEDDSGRDVPDWTEYGNAHIELEPSSAVEGSKFGTGYLSLPANGDYLGSTDFEAFRLDTPGQIDLWFRFPDLNDRVLIGKYFTYDSTYGLTHSFTSLGYKDGAFFLQSVFGVGVTLGAVTSWTLDLNLSAPATVDPGFWYNLRVQVGYDPRKAANTFQVLIQEVALTLIGSDITGSIKNLDPNKTEETPTTYLSQTAGQQALYGQYIGMGYYYDPAALTMTQLYACCDVDELRYARGLVNTLSDRILPTAEFTDPTSIPDPFVVRSRSKVNSIRLIFEFTQGLFRSGETGLFSMSVKFQLDYRLASSSGAWTTSTFTCTAKKTSAARFQTELVFPTRDIYDVQIERLTPEDSNDDSQQRSASYLTSFEEIIDVAQYYPGLQIISLSVKATDIRSGTLDVIRVHHNKTLMDIPYFDGTGYKTVDATIPAYQFIDIFTNLYYGARGNIDSVDQDRIEEWVAWTEGLVGGTPRAKCNIVFDERGTLADAVTAIEQAGRARVTRGSIWSCIVDKPKVSQYTFSAGNIIKDSFDWSGYEDPEKADGVEVSFWNDTRNGQRDSRKAMASWFDTMARVPKIASVEIRGIIDADQAQRQAQFMVNKNEFITRHGKLKSFMRSALVELGDVVNIIPPVSKYVAGGMFSREHYSFSTAYLDQWVLLDATTYSGKLHLYVVDYTGLEKIFEVLGPWDTRTFTLNLDAPLVAKRHDVWGLGRLSEDKLANQIVKKRINPDKKNVDLEWCQYDERIFYHTDWDGGLVEI